MISSDGWSESPPMLSQFLAPSTASEKTMFIKISSTEPITTVERADMVRSRSRSHQPMAAKSTTARIVMRICLSMSPGTEDAATDMPMLVR